MDVQQRVHAKLGRRNGTAISNKLISAYYKALVWLVALCWLLFL